MHQAAAGFQPLERNHMQMLTLMQLLLSFMCNLESKFNFK